MSAGWRAGTAIGLFPEVGQSECCAFRRVIFFYLFYVGGDVPDNPMDPCAHGRVGIIDNQSQGLGPRRYILYYQRGINVASITGVFCRDKPVIAKSSA